jgi:EmrB/QacA subfamily drug resistance transporter
VLVNTTVGSFMALLDSNIVLISLPTIIKDLPSTSTADGIWVVMGYTLMLATILLSIGRLADIHGRVRLYNLGFAVFTVGSALCSLATDGLVLIIFRLVQGLGSALIFANSTAIITDAFPASERGRALGINQIGGVTGSVIGLVAGGVLTATLGWRSIFWINIPVGLFATVWAYKRLKDLSIPQRNEEPDPLGNGLFGIGLTLFLLGLTFGAVSGWLLFDDTMIAVGLLLLIIFLFVERRVKSPMIDLTLFKIRSFSYGILSNLLTAIARGSISIVLVFYFQGALLEDALTAGIKIIPFSIAFVIIGPLSGYLSDRYGAKRFATAGLLLSGTAFVIFSVLPLTTPYPIFVIPMILAGAGGGMFIAPNIASIMNAVPPIRRGVASGISSMLFNVGFLLSIGISFAIMAQSMPQSALEAIFAGESLPSGAAVNLAVYQIAQERIFLVMAIVSFVAAIPSWTRGPETKGSSEPIVIEA